MATDIHALAGAYALDAVDDLERAAFDRHLAGCESCQAEIDELRETAARLADSIWSVPPPRLRAGVLAAIGRTRQVSAPPAVPREHPARWRRWTAAAAAAVVVAGGATAVTWTVQDQRVRDERRLAQVAEQREARIRQILAAPDLVVRTAPMVGGGKVTVASSALQRSGVVLLGADAAPSGGRVFQLWTIRGEAATSAGVLNVGQTTAVQIVDGLPGSDAFGVTAEPPHGSTSPTLPLVAQVSLT
jgi:anti-sigma factor RsiW